MTGARLHQALPAAKPGECCLCRRSASAVWSLSHFLHNALHRPGSGRSLRAPKRPHQATPAAHRSLRPAPRRAAPAGADLTARPDVATAVAGKPSIRKWKRSTGGGNQLSDAVTPQIRLQAAPSEAKIYAEFVIFKKPSGTLWLDGSNQRSAAVRWRPQFCQYISMYCNERHTRRPAIPSSIGTGDLRIYVIFNPVTIRHLYELPHFRRG